MKWNLSPIRQGVAELDRGDSVAIEEVEADYRDRRILNMFNIQVKLDVCKLLA
jgi:predicted transcriptional regulator